jgi:hypothetical protein
MFAEDDLVTEQNILDSRNRGEQLLPWNPKPDDTLRYTVLVTKAVAQETVRINVSVTVLARPDETTDAVLAERVRPALHNFIRGEWMVSGLERQGDAVGFERVSLRAATRVAFAENFNLTERARLASLNGLSIVDPEVDRALAPDKVAVVVKDLWFQVIERVKEHLEHFDRLTGRGWRIGDIEYGLPERGGDRQTVKGARRADAEQFWASTDDAGTLQGAERVSLVARVTLRAEPS